MPSVVVVAPSERLAGKLSTVIVMAPVAPPMFVAEIVPVYG